MDFVLEQTGNVLSSLLLEAEGGGGFFPRSSRPIAWRNVKHPRRRILFFVNISVKVRRIVFINHIKTRASKCEKYKYAALYD